MWQQIAAIWWAQLRTSRNHLPRKTWGSILATLLSILWYGAAVLVGVGFATLLPSLPVPEIQKNLGIGLLGVFLFWQIGPLFTLSSGWSLQLNKLLIYPIRKQTLFAIETFLRLTTAPEMIPVLIGAAAGLLRHRELPAWWGLCILLFIPLNLFLSLSVRELVLHSFERNRFRELFTVLLISIGLLPQLLLRTGLGHRIQPYFSAVSNTAISPWGQTAHLALGIATPWEWLGLAAWTVLFFLTARALFERSLASEETLRSSAASAGRAAKPKDLAGARGAWAYAPSWLFRDPLAALLQKEFQSLVRMPRFRVSFGMACVFSVIVFFPLTFRISGGRNEFLSDNFLVIVTLYGLLILSDALMLNIFGTDRAATQVYFATPTDLRLVFRAKNIVALTFVALQAALVMVVVLLARMPVSLADVLNAIGSAAVVGLFYMAVGNLSSVMVARPIDPAQTFRKQVGAKTQIWLLFCSIGTMILVGTAYLARWAVGANWGGLLVLTVELGIGMIVYKISLDSAVERAARDTEKIMSALSKNASPIGSGS